MRFESHLRVNYENIDLIKINEIKQKINKYSIESTKGDLSSIETDAKVNEFFTIRIEGKYQIRTEGIKAEV